MGADEFYNQDEELEIAFIKKNKAEYAASAEGKSPYDVAEAGRKSFDEARTEYALEFLKRLEKRLSELDNQEISNLLLALMAAGLSIEDDEELEYWINRLERESLHRIAVYFISRNEGLATPGSLKMSPNHKKKLLKNIRDFTAEDIEAFTTMMGAINQLMPKKAPKNKNSEEYKKYLEKAKFFKRGEKLLKRDTQEKKKEDRRRQQEKSNDEANNKKPDYLQLLKEKMESQGIENGSNYWNNVIGDFNRSENKAKFVQQWEKNDVIKKALDEPEKLTKEQLRELRGIDNKEFRKVTKEKLNQKSNSDNGQGKSGISPQNIAGEMSR